jgi:hypothetical protein
LRRSPVSIAGTKLKGGSSPDRALDLNPVNHARIIGFSCMKGLLFGPNFTGKQKLQQ